MVAAVKAHIPGCLAQPPVVAKGTSLRAFHDRSARPSPGLTQAFLPFSTCDFMWLKMQPWRALACAGLVRCSVVSSTSAVGRCSNDSACGAGR